MNIIAIIKNQLLNLYASYFIILLFSHILLNNGHTTLPLFMTTCIVILHFIIGGLIAFTSDNPMHSIKKRFSGTSLWIALPSDILLSLSLALSMWIYSFQTPYKKKEIGQAIMLAGIGNIGCVSLHALSLTV